MHKLTSFEHACEIIGIKIPKTVTPAKKADIIFQAACKLLKIDPKVLPITKGIARLFALPQIALYKLQVIHKAVNGKWKADWNNGSQPKWYCYFWLDNPGFRLHDVRCALTTTAAGLGSRLCSETSAQARFIGTDCIWLYKDLAGAEKLAPIKKDA